MKPLDRIDFTHRNLAFVFLLGWVAACSTTGIATAATIFESATLGPTGIPFSDLTSGAVPATNVSSAVYTGVRFELTQPVITSQIGGHFVERTSGTFFGAIVALDGENDFPDSGDFSTSDFLGETLLTFPNPSGEVLGDLSLSLEPGWYALVFGSGLFDATGEGAVLRNGVDIGDPTYIGFQPGSGVAWINRVTTLNRRFVITGDIVPEPTSIVFAISASLFALLHRRPY